MKKVVKLLPIISLGIFMVYSKNKVPKFFTFNEKVTASHAHSIETNNSIKLADTLHASKSKKTILTIENIYSLIKFNENVKPSLLCFTKAFEAYRDLDSKGLVENDFLTLIDFSLPSTSQRLWVINMKTYEIAINSLVAHGNKSGLEYATSFSNKLNSFQSSLGIYLTGEVYNGKNGFSMRLDGLNTGYNDMARERGVVVHGADYVSDKFIANNGHLGRSQGCPAVPTDLNEKLINMIKDRSVMFIYHPSLEAISSNQSLQKLNLQSIIKRNI